MVNCAILGCNNDSKRKIEGVRFFAVPTALKKGCEKTKLLSEKRRLLWIQRINRKKLSFGTAARYTSVCSIHFISGAPSNLFDNTSPDWAPSLHLGYDDSKNEKKVIAASSRYLRLQQRGKSNKPCIVSEVKKSVGSEKERKEASNIEMVNQSGNGRSSDEDEQLENEKMENDNIQEDECPSLIIKADKSCMTDLTRLEILNLGREINFFKLRIGNCENEILKLIAEKETLTTELENCKLDSSSRAQKDFEENTKLADDIATLKKELENCKIENSNLIRDNVALRQENKKLKALISEQTLDENVLKKDNAKVLFYTGIPNFSRLSKIYDLVTAGFKETFEQFPHALTMFQEFLIVLMRLRLNLFEQDLAYRFRVAQSTISRIISKWLPIMATRLKCFIVWPDRDCLHETMPEAFRNSFGDNVAVILDCFEIFIDKPSSLLPRAPTWSQYKHHNTAKVLIGITPQGSVSFVSNAWSGRTSDKELTESCGILENLRKGDIVLADRGFNIDESVGFYCARLNIPAFLKGKPHLSYEEAESTRKIAHLRIHVERVIGQVRKKYTILRGTLPIDTIIPKKGETEIALDQIIVICSALVNLCPGIVNLEETT